MDKSHRVENFKVRFWNNGRTPNVSSDLRGNGLYLLDAASYDWLFDDRLSDLSKARRSGDHWAYWGEVVYCVGSPGLVHLSESVHHYEDLQDFVTITESQFDQILADFEEFKTNRVDFERQY